MSITDGTTATELTGVTVDDTQTGQAQAFIETVIGRTETTIDASTYDRKARDLEHLARAIAWQAAYNVTAGNPASNVTAGLKSLSQPDLSFSQHGTGSSRSAVANMISPLAREELRRLSWFRDGSKKLSSSYKHDTDGGIPSANEANDTGTWTPV